MSQASNPAPAHGELPAAAAIRGVAYAADQRIENFIDLLRYSPHTTLEVGATCSNPTFKQSPSTPGQPIDA